MILNDVLSQGFYFGVSIFCGLLCGIYYDIFFFVRKMSDAGKILTFICDTVFALLCIATTLYFLYIANGFDFKWYMAMGIIAGFLYERLIFKKPVAYVTEKVYNMYVKLCNFILLKVFKKPLKNTEGKTDDRKTTL